MGESVILSTLYRLFSDASADTNELASTLQSLYENETTKCELGDTHQHFWEGANFHTCPIYLIDFLTYLVVQETAVLLIDEDLEVSNTRANQIWLQSKEYGKAFYSSTDDGRIDDITNVNVRALVWPIYFMNLSLVTLHFVARRTTGWPIPTSYEKKRGHSCTSAPGFSFC